MKERIGLIVFERKMNGWDYIGQYKNWKEGKMDMTYGILRGKKASHGISKRLKGSFGQRKDVKEIGWSIVVGGGL